MCIQNIFYIFLGCFKNKDKKNINKLEQGAL